MEELSTRFYDGIEYKAVVDASAPIEKGIKDIVMTLTLAFSCCGDSISIYSRI